jgi:integrase/recombinase XerD
MMDISDAVELYVQYLLVEKGLSLQTISSYKNDIKQFFEFFTEKKYVEDLVSEDLNEFLRHELTRPEISVSTALRRLSSLRGFFLFLKKEGYFKGEIPDIEAPKKPEHLPNCLTVEEVELLLNAPNIEKPMV